MNFLQPPDLSRAKGFSNGVIARGRTVFLAGIVGWNANKKFETDDFAGQFRQLMLNIVAILKEADARPQHIVNMTWYIGDKDRYLAAQKDMAIAYRDIIGDHFPAMTVIEVSGFVATGTRLEIEATAVIPDPDGFRAAANPGPMRRSPPLPAPPSRKQTAIPKKPEPLTSPRK